jgi:hypothetical protein
VRHGRAPGRVTDGSVLVVVTMGWQVGSPTEWFVFRVRWSVMLCKMELMRNIVDFDEAYTVHEIFILLKDKDPLQNGVYLC